MNTSHPEEKSLSFSTSYDAGTLIMAANSIGCPTDIPLRSLEALRTADLVVFEEDRGARQALKAAGIHRSYLRFSEHKESATIEAIEDALTSKKTVCYMSDQGMPTWADPGQDLLQIAYRLGAQVRVIPGPSSVASALAACPFLEGRFTFVGFLERTQEHRRTQLETLKSQRDPMVIMDTPYRLTALVTDLMNTFGGDRQTLLAIDISGPDEAFLAVPLKRLHQILSDWQGKLNFVLIVAGTSQSSSRGAPAKRRDAR